MQRADTFYLAFVIHSRGRSRSGNCPRLKMSSIVLISNSMNDAVAVALVTAAQTHQDVTKVSTGLNESESAEVTNKVPFGPPYSLLNNGLSTP